MWGFFPLYWKQLDHVPALQILAHRMVWSLLFVGVILAVRRGERGWFDRLMSDRRVLMTYAGAGAILALNWGVYIWAVNAGFVVETSLGYFINPLINVVFGALLLGERPRRGQWGAIGVAACGVIYLGVASGHPPWIALVLAVSFATYGLIKKRGSLGALEGLSAETALLFFPALLFLVGVHLQGDGAFGVMGWETSLFLTGAGIATALPLLFFAAALSRLTLTTMGVMQYAAPTIQFLLGVFLYDEPFGLDRLVGFSLIWGGLVIYTIEGVSRARRERSLKKI